MTETSTTGLALGIFFILAGVAFFLDAVGAWSLRAGVLWPFLLVGFGLALLVGSRSRSSDE